VQSADDAQVHWFSILNSFMIVLFLSVIPDGTLQKSDTHTPLVV
jgi:hypothetical protein